MKTSIEYGRDVIVAAILDGKLRWYASEKELWILDQRKWAEAFRCSGHTVSVDDYSDRFDIPVVNENTAAEFLGFLQEDLVTTAHLHEMLRNLNLSAWDNFSHLMPSLLVDFQRRELNSYYSEPLEFEKYVPDGWGATYAPFFQSIPMADRYWVIDGVDLLSKLPLSGKTIAP